MNLLLYLQYKLKVNGHIKCLQWKEMLMNRRLKLDAEVELENGHRSKVSEWCLNIALVCPDSFDRGTCVPCMFGQICENKRQGFFVPPKCPNGFAYS
jgi:hypothetical protein